LADTAVPFHLTTKTEPVKHPYRLLSAAVLTLCCVLPARATHLMGGEMTARHLGGYDYEVTLTTYRDTLGIPMQTTANWEVIDYAGGYFDFVDVDYSASSGFLLPLFPYGVEVYLFIDTISLPGPGEYEISWSNCCRNGAIINAAAPLSESMYLSVTVTAFDTASAAPNSSPVFLNEPVVFLPVNMPWSYNPLPFDADGDSLAWSIDVPLNAVLDPIDGYYDPLGDTLDPFSIDPATGTITWTPILEGNWVASIVVDEYRGGVHIGRIIRDMQMIVVPTDDSLARFGGLEALGTGPDGNYLENLRVGEPYTLTLYGTDANAGDELRMTANGEPFLLANDPATFGYALTGSGNEIQGTFSWTPLPEHQRMENYIVAFRLDDGLFATDVAVLFRVGEATGIGGPSAEGLGASLFPNPASGPVVVRLRLDAPQRVRVRVFDEDGRQVADHGTRSLGAGTQDLLLPAMDAGRHYVLVESNGRRQVLPVVSLR
jgi:hypothetical protein